MDQDANILVVDDDVVICQLLDRYLTAAGYRVKTGSNGDQLMSVTGTLNSVFNRVNKLDKRGGFSRCLCRGLFGVGAKRA